MNSCYINGLNATFMAHSKRRAAFKRLHEMYLKELSDGTFEENYPMSFPEFVGAQNEIMKRKGKHEDK